MTIEITLPIKCSAVKRIQTQYVNIFRTLSDFFALLLLPLGILSVIVGVVNLIFRFYTDDTSQICIGFGLVGVTFGCIMWYIKPPVEIKCIQDEVDE